jgi:hypothetical protein
MWGGHSGLCDELDIEMLIGDVVEAKFEIGGLKLQFVWLALG